jgi:hypothetical protein
MATLVGILVVADSATMDKYVNTFDAPKTVAPKPVPAKVQGDQLTVTLEPNSVTVAAVQP